MPKKLDDYEFPKRTGRAKYDWDLLLDGSVWEIGPEDLGAAKVASFLGGAKNQANRRHLRIVFHQKDDTTVVIQAVPA